MSASVRSPGRTRSVSMGTGSSSMFPKPKSSASVGVVVVAVEAFLWRRWLVARGAVGLERCWRGVEVLSWRRKGVVRGAEAVHVDKQEAGPRNLCRPRISMSLTGPSGCSWWRFEAADNHAAEPEPDSKILAVRPIHPPVARPALTTETTRLSCKTATVWLMEFHWAGAKNLERGDIE